MILLVLIDNYNRPLLHRHRNVGAKQYGISESSVSRILRKMRAASQ